STSTVSSWTRSTSTTAGTGTSLAPGGTRSPRRPNGLRPLGSARRGHLGDPRRPQEVPVLAAHVLGGDRTGDPAGHPPGPAPPTWSAGGRPAMRSTGGSWTAAGH